MTLACVDVYKLYSRLFDFNFLVNKFTIFFLLEYPYQKVYFWMVTLDKHVIIEHARLIEFQCGSTLKHKQRVQHQDYHISTIMPKKVLIFW